MGLMLLRFIIEVEERSQEVKVNKKFRSQRIQGTTPNSSMGKAHQAFIGVGKMCAYFNECEQVGFSFRRVGSHFGGVQTVI